jgi:hypothetical protein
MNTYMNKYLKYKLKYIKLKKETILKGGSSSKSQVDMVSLLDALTPPPTPKPSQNDESFEMVEKHSINNIKFNDINIVVNELCCGGEPTQYATRMKHCEDKLHTTGAMMARFSELVIGKVYKGALDGIIKISKSEGEHFEESSTIIKKINYISDHDGLLLKINIPRLKFNFNIISFNLEALCNRSDKPNNEEYKKRLELLDLHLWDIVKDGSIMVCQEIVLQDKQGEAQTMLLNKSINEILPRLKRFNNNLNFISDTYTGGIFYDSNIWNIDNTIVITRVVSLDPGASKENKFSNAYLFSLKSDTNVKIWIVNIHLKAPPIIDGDMFKYVTKPDQMSLIHIQHMNELTNIISKVLDNNNNFQYPIYLCGDFNDTRPKNILVNEILNKILKY